MPPSHSLQSVFDDAEIAAEIDRTPITSTEMVSGIGSNPYPCESFSTRIRARQADVSVQFDRQSDVQTERAHPQWLRFPMNPSE